MAPWADALYACDHQWWRKNEGVPAFAGLKLSCDSRACAADWGIERVTVTRHVDSLLFAERGHVGWGGNSGFQALNLVAQMGVSKIVLVGYDMRIDRGKHWHEDHPTGLTNPTAGNVARWRRVIDAAAETLSCFGIRVINASMGSALERYEKMPFLEALKCK